MINIDGFNEAALGRINDQYGWDISMPSHEHLDPLINLVNQATLTSAKLDSLYRITHDRQRLNDHRRVEQPDVVCVRGFCAAALLRVPAEPLRAGAREFREAAIEPAGKLR